MTLDQLKRGKVVIFSHYATTGACEELRDWLAALGAREVVYVAFPFGRNPDRFIRVERTREGRPAETSRSLFRLKLPEPLAYAKDFAYAVWYAARLARGADVLVAGDNLLALAAALARPLAGIRRVVYYMIDYTPVRYANRLLNALYYWVDRLAATRADAVWPLTEKMIRARFAAGRLDERWVRWYAVPYGSRPAAQGEATFDPLRVVYVGDMLRSKGAALFVPFALALRRLVPGFSLTLIGGGRDLAALREEVRQAGLDGEVEVRGFVASMDDVVAALSKGAVAIAPYEPFDENSFTFYADPGKVKVYLGCGLPVVLTDVPPIARELAREGAGLIASYDAEDLAQKVAAVLRAPDYAAMRARAAALGRQCAWPRVFEAAFARLDEEREVR